VQLPSSVFALGVLAGAGKLYRRRPDGGSEREHKLDWDLEYLAR
jgi:hypothetical protein